MEMATKFHLARFSESELIRKVDQDEFIKLYKVGQIFLYK
mgnify:CR=1 FL=1